MKFSLFISVGGVMIAGLAFGNLLVWGEEPVREPATRPAARAATQPASPLDFTVKTIDGVDQNLADYAGKVVLIVNVASKCGCTPQYAALEKLYEKYREQGLVIVGFPANNFKDQEPGSNEDIKTFCTTKYQVTFPLMAKISVKGEGQAPLYKYLTEKPTAGRFAGEIEWNFAKFLVDRSGKLIARFHFKTPPDNPAVVQTIETALKGGATTQPK